MKKRDLIAFASRPWHEIASADTEHWLARKRELGPSEGIRVSGELWALVRAQRPDWPTPAERDADLEAHRRVSEGLRSVAAPRSR